MDLQQTDSAARTADMHANASGRNAEILARLIAEGRLGPDIGIACRGKVDGAGAQAMSKISAMAMAKFVGGRYFHAPFSSMSHAEGDREDWARRWEAFLNLGASERPLPEDAELVRLAEAVADPALYAGRPVVVVERVFGLPWAVNWRLRDGLRDELRSKYWTSPKTAIPSHRAPAGFTAAIHVRRGDVNPNSHAERYVRNEVVLRHIVRLREAMAPFGRPLTINLYSEGAVEDFRDLADAGCNLHISADTFETFHNMVTADILLSATSTFSYLAGLLSRGIVLDARGRAPEVANWLHRRPVGSIPLKRLRQALLSRMGLVDRCAFRMRRALRRATVNAR
ncbi:MAG TPA: hypothetical protein VFZ03_09275 [Dongiaceae bacterium]